MTPHGCPTGHPGTLGPTGVTRFHVDEAAPHLGGYIIGGDDATFYPHLWGWLVEEQGVRSVIDVGCGEGHAVEFFSTLLPEYDVAGVDGVDQGRYQIATHDYTTGQWEPTDEDGTPLSITGRRFDLAWCCEFVEHVEERYVPNFLATFACAELVLMTHADVGQQGHHHVNLRPWSYWAGVMVAIGYRLDLDLTQRTRDLAALNVNPLNHFVRSGLAFRAL